MLLMAAALTKAQGGFTTVTGTITDPNGLKWACGTITAQLITAGGAAPTLNGVGFSTSTSPVNLGCPTTPGTGAPGSFFMLLADSGVIVPGNTTWKFTVNLTPGIAPPAGTGPQSFSFTTAINCSTNTPATCTSNSMDISTQLSAAAPALSSIVAAATAPAGPNTAIQYNKAGVFGGDANLTWDPVGQSFLAVIGKLDGTAGTFTVRDPFTSSGIFYTSGPSPITQIATGGSFTVSAAQISASAAPLNFAGTGTSVFQSTTAVNILTPIAGTGLTLQTTATRKLGFYGAAPIVQPSVTGTVISGTGLASLLAQLASLGVIANNTTNTNCASAASPAVCGTSAAGSVAVPTGATPTLQINTTAITANSQVMLTVTEAPTTGTRLGVTCNTTLSTLVNPVEISRVAGSSFTIQMNSTLAINPACVHYMITN
jgi:hypothetical protein